MALNAFKCVSTPRSQSTTNRLPFLPHAFLAFSSDCYSTHGLYLGQAEIQNPQAILSLNISRLSSFMFFIVINFFRRLTTRNEKNFLKGVQCVIFLEDAV